MSLYPYGGLQAWGVSTHLGLGVDLSSSVQEEPHHDHVPPSGCNVEGSDTVLETHTHAHTHTGSHLGPASRDTHTHTHTWSHLGPPPLSPFSFSSYVSSFPSALQWLCVRYVTLRDEGRDMGRGTDQ